MKDNPTKGVSPRTEHDFFEDRILIKTKKTFEMFLSEDKPLEINGVYDFYYHTAKWQGTNQPKATDKYVMKGLKIGKERLAYAKKRLVEMGLISLIQKRNKAGEIEGHYIKMNYLWGEEKSEIANNDNKTIQKAVYPHVDEATSGFQPTNALSSNSLNALSSNSRSEDKPSPSPQEIIPPQEDKKDTNLTSLKTVVSIYSAEYKNKYGVLPRINNWGKLSGVLKSMLSNTTAPQFHLLMKTYFGWKGATGDSQFVERRLVDSCYPLEWLPSHVNAMIPYINNVLKIKFDDPQQVERAVKMSLSTKRT